MATKHSETVEAEKLIGQVIHRRQGVISDKESIFYALSIGFSQGKHVIIKTHSKNKISSTRVTFRKGLGLFHYWVAPHIKPTSLLLSLIVPTCLFLIPT